MNKKLEERLARLIADGRFYSSHKYGQPIVKVEYARVKLRYDATQWSQPEDMFVVYFADGNHDEAFFPDDDSGFSRGGRSDFKLLTKKKIIFEGSM